ncbi:hypothetical protein HT102_04765 [Hoyosella sp. G463]|uniref:DUF4352 domain-containing protein n=1 Tax=Lolliginicoccus lacisalsi TaxID=2742202 RepID=A0A927JAP4_9ACTN|nr:hypothetical protein [Lolliginicoccus lacisalsi]MBD8505796.1 hypothetical protein [Lolliginicoccus lacisalsi]
MKNTLPTASAALALAVLLTGCATTPADGSGTRAVEDAPAASAPGAEPAADAPASEPEGSTSTAFGTRGNPIPVGTTVELGPDWQVNVVSVTADATPIVLAQNPFNDEPVPGRQFVMARLSLTYTGDESGTPWLDLTTKYVGADGNAYAHGSNDYCGVFPEPISDVNEQFPGATREANQCWSVPSEAVAGGVILIEESFSFDDTRVFFQGG